MAVRSASSSRVPAETALVSVFLLFALAIRASPAASQTGLQPISELAQPYLGVGEPGLYPGGANEPTGEHLAHGLARAAAVVPRAPDGAASADGWIGLVAVGMSNANQEWSRFERESDRLGRHASRVILVDAARGGDDAFAMDEPTDPYWAFFDGRLAAAGVAPEQVQVVWLKQSVAGEATSGGFPDRMAPLTAALGSIVDVLAARCPNLALVFLSSRIFAGYSPNGREPFAYETAFAVKGAIGLAQAGPGPWLGWGPYPWADGSVARADGLVWRPGDLEGDGIHPASTAEWKVAHQLDRHFASSPLATSWFSPPDASGWLALDAAADTTIDPGAPDTPDGAASALGLEGGRRIYLRFDLGTIAAPVARAKLSLLAAADTGIPGQRFWNLGGVVWDELSVTWNTAPPLPPAPFVVATGWSRGAALAVDVTAAVAAALDAGETSLTLAIDTPLPAGAPANLLARESGEPPRLLLVLESPGAAAPLFVDGFETGDLWRWQAPPP